MVKKRQKPKKNKIIDVYPDKEIGNSGFEYVLKDGRKDTVLLDAVLDYVGDPEYVKKARIYEMTCRALEILERKEKRNLIKGELAVLVNSYMLLSAIHNTSESGGGAIRLFPGLGDNTPKSRNSSSSPSQIPIASSIGSPSRQTNSFRLICGRAA